MAKKEKEREIKKKSFAELPEPIIQHILSFFSEEDATKTSILSKAWLSAWCTKPNLEFNSFHFFRKESKKISKMGSEEKEKGRKKFSKYIKRSLKRYTQQKISIEELNLNLNNTSMLVNEAYSMVDSLVQRCTRVAVERCVKNLHLSAYSELPPIVVGAKSLVELSLRDLKMLHLSNEKLMWHSLKRLCLEFVCIDEAMFDNIISSCPLLEVLGVYDCNEDNDHLQFKVMKNQNLKQFAVSLFDSQSLILAEAPKLESLVCTIHEGYQLRGKYWKTCGLSLHSSQYQNLKMLSLCAVGSITDDFFNNFEQKFPHLRDLSLQSCQDLRRIKISSQSLQRILLVENFQLEEVLFDVPSIELLDFICDKYCEIIPVFSFTTATKGHWISNLRICWRGNVDNSWFLQLKKLLFNLIPSKIFLDIEIEIDGNIELDMNEIKNSLTFGASQELQELSLSLYGRLDPSSILSVLDGFFTICRPNRISQYWVECLHKDVPSMKLMYDMIMCRTNMQDEHHKLQQQINKGWQDDLRQAKVEIYECSIRLIGCKILDIKKQFGYQPEALDWDSILKALRKLWTIKRIIHYTLNWEKK